MLHIKVRIEYKNTGKKTYKYAYKKLINTHIGHNGLNTKIGIKGLNRKIK